jgi:hypothetical protein
VIHFLLHVEHALSEQILGTVFLVMARHLVPRQQSALAATTADNKGQWHHQVRGKHDTKAVEDCVQTPTENGCGVHHSLKKSTMGVNESCEHVGFSSKYNIRRMDNLLYS